jgi:hypothetical protein
MRKEVKRLCDTRFKDLVLSILLKIKVSAFIIDETIIQIGIQHFSILSRIEPVQDPILGIYFQRIKI